MPNVRASSGMIGTNREPISEVFTRSLRSRTKAIVVATCCLPEPRFTTSKAEAGGCGKDPAVWRRVGMLPPSARRFSSRY